MAHLKKRYSRSKDKGTRAFVYQLIDGSLRKTLDTDNSTIAKQRLREYEQGKFGLTQVPTIGEFYEKWIQTKVEPLHRRSQIRDYKQHFNCYILPHFRQISLEMLSFAELSGFVARLSKKLAVRTVRNIVGSSLRALYRDARKDYDALKGKDPFLDLSFPLIDDQAEPAPFSPEERDAVLNWFLKNEPFYYVWVLVSFGVGARPSELSALRPADVLIRECALDIRRSRHLGTIAANKTSKSKRVIPIDQSLMDAILTLPTVALDMPYLFINKHGNPLDANQWAKDYWPRVCAALGIEGKRSYNCRHTFITEMIKSGETSQAVADYCGTSVATIEKHYRGTMPLKRVPPAPHARDYGAIKNTDQADGGGSEQERLFLLGVHAGGDRGVPHNTNLELEAAPESAPERSIFPAENDCAQTRQQNDRTRIAPDLAKPLKKQMSPTGFENILRPAAVGSEALSMRKFKESKKRNAGNCA